MGCRFSQGAGRPVPEPGVREPDRGSMAIWLLGLAVLLLIFGGLALDFWRGLAVQRQMAAVADSAAIAAASGIDEEHYRTTGLVRLDPTRARELGLASVGFQDAEVTSVLVQSSPDGDAVTVVVEGQVELGLLGVFVDQTEPFVVRARAVASPRVVP